MLAGRDSSLRSDHRAAEPFERLAQLRIGDRGELAVERGGFTDGQRATRLATRWRRQQQGRLDERQAGHRLAAEEQIDPFDDERRAVLDFERFVRRHAQLQRATAPQRLGPGGVGELGPDNRRPIRFEPGQNPAAV